MCLAQVKNGLQDCSALGTSLSHCWAFAYNPQTLPAITFTSCQSSPLLAVLSCFKKLSDGAGWQWQESSAVVGVLEDQLESVTLWC